jgi:Tfp pilus assembly protein PilN
VQRTVNHFRTQQGGGALKRIFLCGGGSQLSYLAEFFQEKFKLPVEIFSPLRGVQVAPGVNGEAAAADAHSMAEMVGLALHSSGSCPLEVELVPSAVALSRDTAKRAPALILAGLCVWAMLGAGIAYFTKAVEATKDKVAALSKKANDLGGLANDLAKVDADLVALRTQSGQLEGAVNDRSYWVRMMMDLNAKFDNDLLWLTLIEPLKDGKSLSAPLTPEGASFASGGAGAGALFAPPVGVEDAPASGSDATATAASSAVPPAPGVGATVVSSPYVLRVMGLYRKNDEGQEVVYRYARALASSEFFDVKDIGEKLADYCMAESGAAEEERLAYRFELRLPLKQPMKIK